MVSGYTTRSWPQDIMEHLQHLRWYGYAEEAKTKLLIVAKYIDDPVKLQQLEDKWLYGPSNYSKPWDNWFFD